MTLQAQEELDWTPSIGFEDLVEEMVQSDYEAVFERKTQIIKTVLQNAYLVQSPLSTFIRLM